jgi:hypothetical protein
MKTLKVSLVALVLALGLGSAVAEKIQAAPKAGTQVYSWTAVGLPPFSGTEAQAKANYSCPTPGSHNCATGTAPGVPNDIITKP